MRQTTPTPYTFAAVHVLLPLLKLAWTDATVAVLEAVKGELASGSIRYIRVAPDTPGGTSPGMIFWLEHVEANFLDPATGHDPNWNVGEYTAADLERHLGRKPHIMDFDVTDDMPRAPVQADQCVAYPSDHPAHVAKVRLLDRPLRPGGTISWPEHLEAYEAYRANFGGDQTAERLAARGGFSYQELVDFLGHAPKTWVAR